jgi:3-hydroxyisobutyrate dehydrogenase
MTQIALIGTGIMGAGMAHNLLKAGFPLAVYNRTPAKTQPLVAAGAVAAGSPGEAAGNADVIITVVGNDDASRAMWQEILRGPCKSGALAVECTTISLERSLELGATLAEAGLRYIDCPLTGGRKGAEEGHLTLLVGAEAAALAEARPALEAISREIIHFGPPGTGTAYKLIVNLVAAAQAVALAEGVLLAEKAGLNMERVIYALTTGLAGSQVVKGNIHQMTSGDHEAVNFSTKWMHKDIGYALRMAAEAGQPMLFSSLLLPLFQAAVNRELGDKNFSAVIEALRF